MDKEIEKILIQKRKELQNPKLTIDFCYFSPEVFSMICREKISISISCTNGVILSGTITDCYPDTITLENNRSRYFIPHRQITFIQTENKENILPLKLKEPIGFKK